MRASTGFHLDHLALRSFSEYLSSAQRLVPSADRRLAIEESLVPEGESPFQLEGWCALCRQATRFAVEFAYAWQRGASGRLLPNWREFLDCERCGLRNRVRAAFHLFEQELAPGAHAAHASPAADTAIYITEAVTPAYRWLAERYPLAVGSEYFGEDARPGELRGGIRHESLLALSFADATFDAVLSFDVFEHLPDDRAGFREVFRCLKPGGNFLFSAPFRFDQERGEVRAVREPDGTVRHLLPPEYHGNPIAPAEGSLCYRYFGWDCLDHLAETGFEDCAIVSYWSAELGYLGHPQYLVMARKPATRTSPAARGAA
jgi:SAM-dependent methyltransferase